jgi:hypothetical protein
MSEPYFLGAREWGQVFQVAGFQKFDTRIDARTRPNPVCLRDLMEKKPDIFALNTKARSFYEFGVFEKIGSQATQGLGNTPEEDGSAAPQPDSRETVASILKKNQGVLPAREWVMNGVRCFMLQDSRNSTQKRCHASSSLTSPSRPASAMATAMFSAWTSRPKYSTSLLIVFIDGLCWLLSTPVIRQGLRVLP